MEISFLANMHTDCLCFRESKTMSVAHQTKLQLKINDTHQAWELPKVPGEYTGCKKAEVQGPPRPVGGTRGRIPLSKSDFEDPF